MALGSNASLKTTLRYQARDASLIFLMTSDIDASFPPILCARDMSAAATRALVGIAHSTWAFLHARRAGMPVAFFSFVFACRRAIREAAKFAELDEAPPL